MKNKNKTKKKTANVTTISTFVLSKTNDVINLPIIGDFLSLAIKVFGVFVFFRHRFVFNFNRVEFKARKRFVLLNLFFVT